MAKAETETKTETAQASPATIKNERALSPKVLGFDAKAEVGKAVTALGEKPAPEKLAAIRVPLGLVFGIITGVKQSIDSKTGELRSALVGNFEGRNAVTGEVVRATRCYLPVVQEKLESEFNSLPANIRGNRMKFQANIFAVHNEDRYGYRYSVDLPLADASNDPLADMRSELADM